MWGVESKGNIIQTFTTEDEAWSYIMRGEINAIKGYESLEVVEIIEDEDALIADLLGAT